MIAEGRLKRRAAERHRQDKMMTLTRMQLTERAIANERYRIELDAQIRIMELQQKLVIDDNAKNRQDKTSS